MPRTYSLRRGHPIREEPCLANHRSGMSCSSQSPGLHCNSHSTVPTLDPDKPGKIITNSDQKSIGHFNIPFAHQTGSHCMLPISKNADPSHRRCFPDDNFDEVTVHEFLSSNIRVNPANPIHSVAVTNFYTAMQGAKTYEIPVARLSRAVAVPMRSTKSESLHVP